MLFRSTDGSVGTASAIVQLNIGSANAASFQIAVGITGAYTNNPADALSLNIVTVSKPVTGGYITGGGEVDNSGSSGIIRGHSTLNTDYNFDIQYTKSGTNPKGKAQIIVRSYFDRNGILGSKLRTYIITTNAIALLNVGTPLATGTFSAKANLVEQLDDFSTVAIEGGATFQMVAHQSDCTTQQIAITLHRKAGGIWFSSNWNTTSARTTLKSVTSGSKVYVAGGGVCPATTRSARTVVAEPEATVIASVPEIQAVASEQLEVETLLFKVSAYPNPTTEYFTLRLQGATQSQVQVNVFDVSGRQVYAKLGNYNDTYQFGEHFQAGVYFVNVQQGNEQTTLKVIKK